MSTTDKATILPDGSLISDATITRAGVFLYSSDELGLSGPTRVVRVLRPPEEVFRPESLDSLRLVPVTLDHPREPVSPATFDASGVIGAVGNDIRANGLDVIGTVAVRSATALQEYQDGVRELSAGYTAHYGTELSGVTADGVRYSYAAPGPWIDAEGQAHPFDLVQSDVVYNHVAQVRRGRAGNARFNDSAAGFSMIKTNDSATGGKPNDFAGLQGETKKPNDSANLTIGKDEKSNDLNGRQTVDADEMVEIELGGYTFEVSAGLAAAINMLKDAAGIKPKPEPEPEMPEAPKPEELLAQPSKDAANPLVSENEKLRKELDQVRDQAVRDSVCPVLQATGQDVPKATLDAVKLAIRTRLPGAAVDHLTTVDGAMAMWRTIAALPVKDSAPPLPTTRDSKADPWKNGAPSLAR